MSDEKFEPIKSHVGIIRSVITGLAPGLKSSEFIGVAAYFIYLVLSSLGILTPGKVAQIQTGAEAAKDSLPIIINAVQNIIAQFGDQTLIGGLLWAYLKRRYSLKKDDLEIAKLQKTAEIEKYKAYTASKGYKK